MGIKAKNKELDALIAVYPRAALVHWCFDLYPESPIAAVCSVRFPAGNERHCRRTIVSARHRVAWSIWLTHPADTRGLYTWPIE